MYDSTQTGTLKNKVLSIDKLKCRQQKLTIAAHKVIDHFKLEGAELFPIVKHLIPLFATAVQGFYYVMGNTKRTQVEQLKFYNENFDKSLYFKIKELEVWRQFAGNNEMLILALNCQFAKINTKLSIIDKKIRLKSLINQFFSVKSVVRLFSKSVTILNK